MRLKRYLKFLFNLLTRKNKYFYVGGYPHINNLGDQALYFSYQKLLGKKLIHFQGGMVETTLAKILADKNDLAFLAGGTLINRLGLFSLQDAYKIFNQVNVIGTGVAQNYFWVNQTNYCDKMDDWMTVLKKSSYLAVRGPLGKRLLEEYGAKQVQIFGDPVITLACNEKKAATEKKVIGINVGISKDGAWVSEIAICNLYNHLVCQLKQEHWEIHWLVVCDTDLPMTKKLASETKTEQFMHVIYNDPYKYIQICQKMSVFIGLKLHSVVLSHCAYTPSIMLEYRPKCLDYMMSVGEEDNCFRLDKIHEEILFHKISELYLDQDKYINRLYANINVLKKQQTKIVNEILNS
ncbi:MAG: hypothetical protein A2381_04400 [Bdellovibrionales bacterium RIFOXYB1_FULL_37_110]|nr:MAG: hypothetical protein A2417_15980 [Bdellovibrionales bacterium RIFOXYC1_FULL_37_79]OFZ57408.1 MAG: hypothetical protein A2381_04400 [Bdellovibrionales bacterium RIFOXYB1_FULL_37_110]OFZ62260.1 MAG: hypothetical protein A2577_12920 [Bdellovibrionales bacterium RIFOXYD1_FULL_36_51]